MPNEKIIESRDTNQIEYSILLIDKGHRDPSIGFSSTKEDAVLWLDLVHPMSPKQQDDLFLKLHDREGEDGMDDESEKVNTMTNLKLVHSPITPTNVGYWIDP